ncbi:hypothetical protein FRC01_012704, partial [Tulasnella sp. 417]
MSTSLAPTALREAEYALLQCDASPLTTGSGADSILDIVRDVAEGQFKGVLMHELAKPLLSISNETSINEEGVLGGDLRLQYTPPGSLDDPRKELLRLAIGVASLHAFVQANWTGPDLD